MLFEIRTDSLKEVKTNVALLYGRPDGAILIDMEKPDDFKDLAKEQNCPIQVTYEGDRAMIFIMDEE